MHAAALAEDATVFDYDGHYDAIQQTRTEPKRAEKIARESRYIAGLLEKAEERKREQDVLYERQLAKERAAEDHLFGDKERFVTAAYRRKLEEDAKWKEEQKKMWVVARHSVVACCRVACAAGRRGRGISAPRFGASLAVLIFVFFALAARTRRSAPLSRSAATWATFTATCCATTRPLAPAPPLRGPKGAPPARALQCRRNRRRRGSPMTTSCPSAGRRWRRSSSAGRRRRRRPHGGSSSSSSSSSNKSWQRTGGHPVMPARAARLPVRQQ
jgi:hypothetical protein